MEAYKMIIAERDQRLADQFIIATIYMPPKVGGNGQSGFDL
jgi:hypothetical protein